MPALITCCRRNSRARNTEWRKTAGRSILSPKGRFPGTPLTLKKPGVAGRRHFSVIRLAVIYLAVIAVGFVFHYGQFYLLNKTGQQIIFDLRHHVFSHLQQMSLRFLTPIPSAASLPG